MNKRRIKESSDKSLNGYYIVKRPKGVNDGEYDRYWTGSYWSSSKLGARLWTDLEYAKINAKSFRLRPDNKDFDIFIAKVEDGNIKSYLLGESLNESSMLIDEFSISDNEKLKAYWDKNDGYVVEKIYNQGNDLWRTDFKKTFHDELSAKRYFSRAKKKFGVNESVEDKSAYIESVVDTYKGFDILKMTIDSVEIKDISYPGFDKYFVGYKGKYVPDSTYGDRKMTSIEDAKEVIDEIVKENPNYRIKESTQKFTIDSSVYDWYSKRNPTDYQLDNIDRKVTFRDVLSFHENGGDVEDVLLRADADGWIDSAVVEVIINKAIDLSEGVDECVKKEVKEDVDDEASYNWLSEVIDRDVKFHYTDGGYTMQFESEKDYKKAKDLADKHNFKGGKWFDEDLQFCDYHSTRVGMDYDD